LEERLRSALDADAIVDASGVGAYAFNGFTPRAVVRPGGEAQVTEVVRAAIASKACVLPRGGGTKIACYPTSSRPTIVLSTERLNSVVEYTPRDMTITAQSGIKLADLNEVVSKEGQRLPLDPPSSQTATIGGILAANDSGPIRLGNGTARDLVLGMRMVLADGTAVKSGAKVVKNAAGYDLHRLFIGGAGTLGLISEVTLRLRPIPDARRLVVLRAPDCKTAGTWAIRIMGGETRPTMLDLLSGPAVERCVDRDDRNGVGLVVGFEETAEAVDWQCDHLVEAFGDAATAYDDDGSRSLYERIREWPAESAALAFTATMQPSHVPAFVEQATQLGWAVVARACNGVAYGMSADDHRAEEFAALRSLAAEGGGTLTVTRDAGPPADFGWHQVAAAEMLMRGIKGRFDPNHVFGDGP